MSVFITFFLKATKIVGMVTEIKCYVCAKWTILSHFPCFQPFSWGYLTGYLTASDCHLGGGKSSFLLTNCSRFFKGNWTNEKDVGEHGFQIFLNTEHTKCTERTNLNKNHKNTLLWANPHSSGFDVAGLCRAYVSKLTRPPQPTAISAVPALCPPQGDKPRLRLKTAAPSFILLRLYIQSILHLSVSNIGKKNYRKE